ncbi:MAG: roadblock/LC7 domain-containing protein [Methanomicrobiaceae archaeon]|nr:roadblock/LC7 domain-containing protein [Methanomicrobiaceae archaeon]
MTEENPLKAKIRGYIDEIQSLGGVVASVIVSTDGKIIGKSNNTDFPSPFLGITGATIFASSEAACGTFHMSRPDFIVIETMENDGLMVIKRAGKRNIIATVINQSVDISSFKNKLALISDRIGEDL